MLFWFIYFSFPLALLFGWNWLYCLIVFYYFIIKSIFIEILMPKSTEKNETINNFEQWQQKNPCLKSTYSKMYYTHLLYSLFMTFFHIKLFMWALNRVSAQKFATESTPYPYSIQYQNIFAECAFIRTLYIVLQFHLLCVRFGIFSFNFNIKIYFFYSYSMKYIKSEGVNIIWYIQFGSLFALCSLYK